MELRKLINGFLGEFAYNNKIVRSINHPTVFAIETTNSCNLNCIMCPRKKMSRKIGVMNFDLFKKIVDEAKDYNRWILLHGMGEPLLDKGIYKKIDYCENKGIKVELSSNCAFLNPDNADKLLNTKLSRLILSLDAVTKKTYNAVRQRGNFKKVIQNIEYLIDRKNKFYKNSEIELIIQIIIMKDNIKELDEFKKKWKDKVDKIYIKPFSTWGGQLKEIGKRGVKGHRYYNGSFNNRSPCYYLWKSLVVLWDGKVVPCCRDFNGKIILGDLKKQSLQEIWKGKKLKNLRKMHLKGYFNNTLCDNCYDLSSLSPKFFYPLNKIFLYQIIKKK